MADKIKIRSYCSASGVVLLALHWKPPAGKPFFGFSIKRTPGFFDPNSNVQVPFSWLPNRLSFHGPLDQDAPSNVAPIQKFMWWDARFHPKEDKGKEFVYQVTALGGSAEQLEPIAGSSNSIKVKFPARKSQGVSTWFNRPFVSSQAFSRLMQKNGVSPKAKLSELTPKQRDAILGWLSNDLHEAILEVLAEKANVDGAVYHFSDEQWLKGAFAERAKDKTSLAVHWKNEGKDKNEEKFVNERFVTDLAAHITFRKREHPPKLMHDKILVVSNSQKPVKVLMGSANFTTGALTSQANVLHVWDYPKLAELYKKRVELLQRDEHKGKNLPAQWSEPVALSGGGEVRVFFPPEPGPPKKAPKKPKPTATSIKPIVDAIKAAKSSVVFCFFDSTDEEVRNACFDAAKRGLMMFGLVNRIPKKRPENTPQNKAHIALFDHAQKERDIVAASALSPLPQGWLKEISTLGAGDQAAGGAEKNNKVPDVHIHHKFILIDGETSNSVLYTGSANISGGSAYYNDENLMEIKGARELCDAYLAEFFRLFEHYRFRFDLARHQAAVKGKGAEQHIMRLDDTGRKWLEKFTKPGTPEERAVKRLASS